MYSFGTRPPRALESFGVTGLLGEECQVFYENLFSTKHVGRVSDLLCARIKDAGMDELKVRATILMAVFEAYRTQSPESKPLEAPLVLELGIDQEKIAIGLSFVEKKSAAGIQAQGIKDRIVQGKPQGAFETLVVQMLQHSDRLVLRIQSESNRFELVSVLGLPGKVKAEALTGGAAFEVVQLTKAQATQAPKAKTYTQLGDLDYPELLRDEGPKGKAGPAKDIAETLVKGTATKSDEVILVKGAAPEKELERTVKGTTDNIDDRVHVKSKGESLEEELIKVKGQREEIGGGGITVVKGSGADLHDRGTMTVKSSDPLLLQKMKEYEEKIALLEKKNFELQATKAGASDGEEKEEKKGVFGFFKKALSIGKKKKKTEEQAEVAPALEVPAAKTESKDDVVKISGTTEEIKTNELAIKETPEELLEQAQSSGLSRTVERVVKEVVQIKKEIPSARAKTWMDGVVSELVAEKNRLNELFKKMSQSFRQKEYGFKNKEFGFNEELRRRQEAITQRDAQIARLKDQISEITMTIERLRTTSKDSGDNSPFKHKFQMAQKMLQQVKDENTDLKSKVDEFRSKWLAAQGQAKSVGAAPMDKEVGALRVNFERATRQIEELKAKNLQMNEKLTSIRKEESLKGNVDDVRRKLESAQEKATGLQKENELLNTKNNELSEQMDAVREELAKAQAEMRVAQSRATKAEARAEKAEKEKKAALAAATPAKPGAKPPQSGTPPKAA